MLRAFKPAAMVCGQACNPVKANAATLKLPLHGAAQGRIRGFTLVELIVVIVVLAIVSTIAAVFIRRPIESYADSVRRAELTDIADTALRRIVRDLRFALPNSVRVANPGGASTAFYLEFLMTSGGGRYRAAVTGTGTGNPLDFSATDSSFDVLGPMPTLAANDSIVIYNLGTGFTGADAYAAANNNRAVYLSNTATTITLSAAKLFPLASPGNRFHVVPYAVTYTCNPAAGANEIRRHWNYGITATQTPTPPALGSSAQLARNVSACSITYDQNAIQGRNGIVSLGLQMTGTGGETVSLFQETHVSNVP